ncbi:SCO family protein [Evansella sp. AB-rgal1]|uniref:SCO family protein n=1 Tax=Evansella sp. AB-rgal1 TaxID=3242696 RepID=UPI00359E33CB
MRKIFLLGIALFFLQGCSFLYQDPSPPQSQAIVDITQTDTEMHIASVSGLNQFGDEWSTDDMLGEYWIAKTIFTRCPTVCLTMTPNMVELQQAMADEGLEVNIVSFTVDPDFDDAERLQHYGEGYGADFDNWDFVTGYEFEQVQDFVLESFRLPIMRDEENNDISHPTRFYVVNPEGEIIRLYRGETGFDLDSYIKDLNYLINN